MIKNILVHFIDVKKDSPFRMFYTNNPKAILDMYSFAMENELEIEIENDDKKNDMYQDCIGFVKEITMTPGGNAHIPCIKIYLEVI